MTPNPNAKHAEKMAELLAIYDEHKSAGLIQAIDYADSLAAQLEAERRHIATLDAEAEKSADAFEELCEACGGAVNRSAALDWVKRTKRQLEAEREKRAEAEAEAGMLLSALKAMREGKAPPDSTWLLVNDTKSTAAGWLQVFVERRERAEAAEAKLRAAERVIQVLRGGDAGWALRDALDAYDAINPDGSTGGAGEGVG